MTRPTRHATNNATQTTKIDASRISRSRSMPPTLLRRAPRRRPDSDSGPPPARACDEAERSGRPGG